MKFLKRTDIAKERAKDQAKEELRQLRAQQKGKNISLKELEQRVERIERILGIE